MFDRGTFIPLGPGPRRAIKLVAHGNGWFVPDNPSDSWYLEMLLALVDEVGGRWPSEFVDRWGVRVSLPELTVVRVAWLLCEFSKYTCFVLTGCARRLYEPRARSFVDDPVLPGQDFKLVA